MSFRIAVPAVALVLAAVPAAAQEPDPSWPLSLAEAVQRALDRNEGLVVSREALVAAEAGSAGARGAYDPLLSADAGWRKATPPVNSAFTGAPEGRPAPTVEGVDAAVSVRQLLPTGGTIAVGATAARTTTDDAFTLLSPAYATRLGVEVRQPLLRGRALDLPRLTVRVADLERERAGAELRREVADTVAAVERAYWALAAAREEVAVRAQAVALAGEQLSLTRSRIEAGAAPESEEAQPRAELERRRGELLAAREAASRADNALKLLVLGEADAEGWSRPIRPMADAEVREVAVDTAAAVERALASRPELASAGAAVRRREAETLYARAELRPALDAVASYERFGLSGRASPGGAGIPGQPVVIPPRQIGGWGRSFDVLTGDDFDDARVGVVLSVPIGNRAARGAARAAESAGRQAEAELALARKQVRVEVLDAAAALATAFQRFEAARAQREAAEVQLSAEQDRYAAGLSTNFLVLTRQNDLSRARVDELSARADYHAARTGMARATGSLLEDRGISVEDPAEAGSGR